MMKSWRISVWGWLEVLSCLFLVMLFVLPVTLAQTSAPEMRLDKISWEFGEALEGALLETRFSVTNVGTENLQIDLRPSCECIGVNPGYLAVEPGGAAVFAVSFDTKGYQGSVTHYLFMDTNDPQYPHIQLPIEGEVLSQKSKVASTTRSSPATQNLPLVRMSFFYSPGCRYCQKLRNEVFPQLGKKLQINLEVAAFPLSEPDNYQMLSLLEEKYQRQSNEIPVLVIGRDILGGERQIKRELESLIRKYREEGADYWPHEIVREKEGSPEKIIQKFRSYRLLPVLVAGLADGVNPCAFATLIFLISYLVLLKRNPREILVVGMLFSLSVFVTYLGVGWGLFSLLKISSSYSLVGNIIRYVAIGLAFGLGAISLYDFYLCLTKRSKKVILQLPKRFKKTIHSNIRRGFGGWSIFPAACFLGFGVSFFELACTGQIYLPTIVYINRISPGNPRGIFYLVLYNLLFILPLLLIFLSVYLGVSWQRLSGFLETNLGKLKLVLALVFFALGAFLLWGP